MQHLVVLAGGRGERLGGIDKALCVVGGVRLIDHALAVPVAGRRVVVRPTSRSPIGERPCGGPVEEVSEHPPGGGPAAGLAAAVRALVSPPSHEGPPARSEAVEPNDLIAVLAGDQLGPLGPVVDRLAAALLAHPEHGVAVSAPQGQPQWLTCVWRAGRLIDAVDRCGDPDGAPVRAIVALGDPLPAEGPRVPSLDRPEDLAAALGDGPLGIAGPGPWRAEVAAAIGLGATRPSVDAVDPAGGAAVVVHPASPGRRPTAIVPKDRPQWVVVGPAEVPSPDWAAAKLVPLGRGAQSSR